MNAPEQSQGFDFGPLVLKVEICPHLQTPFVIFHHRSRLNLTAWGFSPFGAPSQPGAVSSCNDRWFSFNSRQMLPFFKWPFFAPLPRASLLWGSLAQTGLSRSLGERLGSQHFRDAGQALTELLWQPDRHAGRSGVVCLRWQEVLFKL